MFVALVCPNTLQILAPYEPALGVKPGSTAPMIGRIPFRVGSLASLGNCDVGDRGDRDPLWAVRVSSCTGSSSRRRWLRERPSYARGPRRELIVVAAGILVRERAR